MICLGRKRFYFRMACWLFSFPWFCSFICLWRQQCVIQPQKPLHCVCLRHWSTTQSLLIRHSTVHRAKLEATSFHYLLATWASYSSSGPAWSRAVAVLAQSEMGCVNFRSHDSPWNITLPDEIEFYRTVFFPENCPRNVKWLLQSTMKWNLPK